jgi:hypothetical protein
MTGFGNESGTSARDDRDQLARRRHEAQVRLTREREHGARRALAAYVVLAALLGLVIHYGFASFASAPREERLSPAQQAAKQFAESRIADVRFRELDGSICHDMQFKNDTGQFLNDKVTPCEKAPVPTTAARALAIREGFQRW